MPKEKIVIDCKDFDEGTENACKDKDGNIEYKCYLNIVEGFSKYVFSYLLPNKKANTIREKLNETVGKLPGLKWIQCDNGSNFLKNINLLFKNCSNLFS